jgi:hypothetical protein
MNNSVTDGGTAESRTSTNFVKDAKAKLIEILHIIQFNRVGIGGATLEVPEITREEVKEGATKIKEDAKTARRKAQYTKKIAEGMVGGKDRAKADRAAAEALKDEQEAKEAEVLADEAKGYGRSLPPEVIPDEETPWFGKIYANGSNYYIDNGQGGWNAVNETNAGRFLKELGISDRKDTELTSPLDRTFTALQKRHKVDYAGPLAGHRTGLIEYNGNKILITRGPNLINPVKGDFTTIAEYLDGMLQEQRKYADCWLHLAVTPIYNCEPTTGQVLVLAGAPDTGKSVFQKLLVTPMLGGRVAMPYQYMIGDTTFNEDWFSAEHLMIEDEGAGKDINTRNLFAAKLKQIAVNEDQRNHGKGNKALYLPPCWRATVSVNDDPEHIRVLPPMDSSVKDKLIILKVYDGATVKLVEKLGGRAAFAAKIKEERPAYLYWLLNEFEIPADLKATRLSMKAFQHPDILEAIEETSPQRLLLEHMESEWVGVYRKDMPLTTIAKLLEESGPPNGVLPRSPTTLGRYLTDISKMTDKVSKRTLKGSPLYTVDFRTSVDLGHHNGSVTKSHAKQREAARAARQEEEKWEYSKVLEMLKPEDRAAIMKAHETAIMKALEVIPKATPGEMPV